jgi:hypothetical protein
LAFSLALALLFVGSAQAGFLANDSDAMSGWRGDLAMYGTKTRTLGGVLHTFTLSATIDYAVYAPGSFDLSFPNADPSGNTDYVYAYQFVDSSASTEPVVSLSVGFGGDAHVATEGQVADPLTGGQASETPKLTGSPPTSATWSYLSATVSPGHDSDILFYTSPYGPQWGHGSLLATNALSVNSAPNGVTLGPGNALPTPTPEPAAVVLLATAAALFALRRVVRRRRHG